MSDNIPRNKESLGRRGGYLIPPLPATKTKPEKDSKARSPLGRSYKNRGNAYPFPNHSEGEAPSSSRSLVTTRFQRSENDQQQKVQDANRGALAPLPFTSNNSKRIAPRGAANVTIDKENGLPLLPSSSRRFSSTKTTTSSRRSTDALDATFGLTSQSSAEYRQLCHSIADGRRLDDAAAWRRLLELARDQADAASTSLATSIKQRGYVLRLHRKATQRFPLSSITSDYSAEVQIWLSYSEIMADVGSNEECRQLFQDLGKVAEKEAAFYLSFARFEKRNKELDKAKEILQLGVSKDAKPLKSLHQALNELARSAASPLKRDSRIEAPTLRKQTQGSKSGSQALSPRKRRSETNVSPKRRKTETGAIEVRPNPSLEGEEILKDASHKHNSPSGETDKEAGSGLSGTLKKSNWTSDSVPNPSQLSCVLGIQQLKLERIPIYPPRDTTCSASKVQNTNQPGKTKTQQSASKSRIRLETVCKEGSSGPKRPSLLSKTPRLSRVGLSGTAQRIGTGSSAAVEHDIDSSDEDTKTTTTFTQKDLSYIVQWNPAGFNEKHTDVARNKEKTGDESTKASNSSKSRSSRSAQSTVTLQSDSSDSSAGSSHTSRRQSAESSIQVTPAAAKLISNANADFLPLVSESNILKVNNVPYVKLGVVGKGGSSKVYRALSKELNVLAIKRVKLGGMDQKAIDGYANEIALLKQLRKNPAIIQMLDSEVDLSRKVLLVVMEAGEADLNHVLHQRTKSDCGATKALDMNFTRLTWQQMLNAVHSIHEARIIHGDLKPANFLFVRGTLKLIDFGIAKAMQNEDTTNIYRDSNVGTLNYMSPEAILDSGSGTPGAPKMKCGRASDIWSLGCILYQMVYGRTPFAELHMIQKLQAIVDPSHRISYPDTVNAAAIDAIQQCLRRKAADRPPIVGAKGLLNEHVFLNEDRLGRNSE